MRASIQLLVVAVGCLATDVARADVLIAGHKPVAHELVLVDSPALGGWTLFAAPVAGFGGVAPVEVGAPFDFSSKYGTRLYALPAGEPLPEEWGFDSEPAPGWASGELPVQERRSAPIGHPLARVLTSLRVDAIDVEDGIALSVLDERRFAADGGPVEERWRMLRLLALGCVGVLGALAVLVLRRRRARVAAEGR